MISNHFQQHQFWQENVSCNQSACYNQLTTDVLVVVAVISQIIYFYLLDCRYARDCHHFPHLLMSFLFITLQPLNRKYKLIISTNQNGLEWFKNDLRWTWMLQPINVLNFCIEYRTQMEFAIRLGNVQTNEFSKVCFILSERIFCISTFNTNWMLLLFIYLVPFRDFVNDKQYCHCYWD